LALSLQYKHCNRQLVNSLSHIEQNRKQVNTKELIMYSHFLIASQLPEVENALNYQKCLVLGNYLMLVSLIIVSLSITINFVFEEQFAMPVQISAHILTIIFAALLKIGYVLRCIALHGFGKRNF